MYKTRCLSRCHFSDLIGETIVKIEKLGDFMLIFHTNLLVKYIMHHENECSENVYIESIIGDLEDLIGSPILRAAEEVFEPQLDEDKIHSWDDSVRWTFYKLATHKGYVDIRWYGCSNGYYGVTVDFLAVSHNNYEEIKKDFTNETKITIFD